MRKNIIVIFTLILVLLSGCASSVSSAPDSSNSTSEIKMDVQSETEANLYLTEPSGTDFTSPCIYNNKTKSSITLNMDTDDLIGAGKETYVKENNWIKYEGGITQAFDKDGKISGIIVFCGNKEWQLFNGIYPGENKSEIVKAIGEPNDTYLEQAYYYFDENMTQADQKNSSASMIVDYEKQFISIQIEDENEPKLTSDNAINVYDVSTSAPNSSGGVDANISFSNISDKAIKYIYFTVTPYNAVGDPVNSEIGNESTIQLKVTGPIEPDQEIHESTSNCAWYNSDIVSAELESAEIEYMDGTMVNLDVQQ